MFKNLNKAIEQGIKDYEELPRAYPSLESAIKYRIAEHLWAEILTEDTSEAFYILRKIHDVLR